MRNVENIIDAYEAALVDSSVSAVDVKDFVQELHGHPLVATLVELLRIRMERQFEAGDYGGLEACVCEFPFLSDDADSLQQLAFEELRLRNAHQLSTKGLAPYVDWDTLSQTPPPVHSRDRRLPVDIPPDIPLSNTDWSSSHPSNSNEDTPSPDHAQQVESRGRPSLDCGEPFGPFRVVCELGSGALARVYLAQQLDLSERWVVLKVCSTPTREPHRLAELNHLHVVPIISLHQVRGFQVICMPFYGATTVEHLIATIHQPRSPRRAPSGSQQLSELLISTVRNRNEYVQTKVANQTTANSQPRRLTAYHRHDWLREWQGKDLETVCCKLMLQVAEGLQHAHAGGLIHCDIKPANLLVGDDGNARIVDFHVARIAGRHGVSHDIGGTLPYMSPEQKRAFHSGMEKIGPQSDLYSLGIVFYQLLSGELPRLRARNASPNAAEPNVTLVIDHNLASPDCMAVVDKLLQQRVEDRYRSATELIEDLRRHLESRPLRHAKSKSLKQRVQKWGRRHPRLASAGSVASVACSIVCLLIASLLWTNRQLASNRLALAVPELADSLVTADLLTVTAGFYPQLATAVPSAIERAVGLLEQLDRDRLLQRMSSADRQRTHAHLLHLLELTNDTNVTFVSRSIGEANAEDSQSLIHRLEQAVQRTRPRHDGQSQPAEPPLPSLQWLESVGLIQQQRIDEAVQQLKEFVASTPDSWSAWLLLGHCLVQQDKHLEAASAYGNACALAPDAWLSWYCRGLALIDEAAESLQPLELQVLAETSFARASQLRPDLDEARFNRALCLEQLGRYQDAIEVLNAIADSPSVALQARLLRSQLRLALGDQVGAQHDLQRAYAIPPRDWNDRLQLAFACLDDQPELSAELLEQVLDARPNNSNALQTLAYLYMQVIPDPEKALRVVQQWMRELPDDATGIASHAVLAARWGDPQAALDSIPHALELTSEPRVLAQLGSAYALLIDKIDDETVKDKALSLLVQSVAMEPTLLDELQSDEDIASVRDELFSLVTLQDGLFSIQPTPRNMSNRP